MAILSQTPAITWALSDAPASLQWPAASDWIPITFNGAPARDFEEDGGNDPTAGTGGIGGGSVDLASGLLNDASNADPANCNPQVSPPQDNCGPATTGFWYCADVADDTTAATIRTRLFLRMRLDGSPGKPPGFNQFHWNHLLDNDSDGFKEFWIDIFGGFAGNGLDQVRVIYQDEPSQSVTNDDPADLNNIGAPIPDTAGTFINSFVACSSQGLTACQDANGNELSHTRITAIADGTGEFYLDVQIPLTEGDPLLQQYVLTKNDGLYVPGRVQDFPGSADEAIGRGTAVVTTCDPTTGPTDAAGFIYSTSNSNEDPVQKDFIFTSFSDTTLASLSRFVAERSATGIRFQWTTAAELGNAGFHLYERSDRGWRRLNQALIPSRVVDSVSPQDYVFETGAVSGTEFVLVDVDIEMKERRHGPFRLGVEYGEIVQHQPVDWVANNMERTAKSGIRLAGRKGRLHRWRGRSDRSAASRGKDAAFDGGALTQGANEAPLMELHVDEDGIHRISHETLVAAGLDLTGVPAGQIALTRQGQPVPVRVSTSGGVFGPGAYLEFIGHALTTRYTHTNVYRLHVAADLVLPMHEDLRTPGRQSPAESYQATVQVNENRAYAFTAPIEDPWYEARLLAFGRPTTQDFPLHVDGLVPDTPSLLTVNAWGGVNWPASPDHHLVVELNGVQVAQEIFDGVVALPLSIDLPPGLLRNGSNTLTLRLPYDLPGVGFDMVNLDSYGVTYRRSFTANNGSQLSFEARGQAFEVTGLGSADVVVYRVKNGNKVDIVTGVSVGSGGSGFTAKFRGDPGRSARYYVATTASLLQPRLVPAATLQDITSGSADYLVISHPDFIDGLTPLLEARRTQFASVRVVDVEQIYAQFSGGVFDPDAIRAYVRHAVVNLGTRAVLLVGGDTYDYQDYLGLGSVSYIPSLYVDAGGVSRHTPADPLFGDIDGDLVPDVAVGRFPVRNERELAAMVRKTLDFSAAGHHGKAVFAADDEEPQNSFSRISDSIIDRMPVDWSAQRIYLDELGATDSRTTLLAALNRGDAAMISFVGHSGPFQWTANSPALLNWQDAARLTNAAPGFVAQWGCWMDHLNPRYSTLVHKLLLNDAGGAAAVFGLASASTATADRLLAPMAQEGIMTRGQQLGTAILEAKRQLAQTHPQLLEVILGGTLLGDPALIVNP